VTGPTGPTGGSGADLLSVEGLDVRYGDFLAVSGVDLAVREGETLAVLGANGAGKSTLLKAVTGLLPPAAGTIRFRGGDLRRVRAHRRVGLGIAMVPEGRRMFPSLTVEENLLVGARVRRPGPWSLDAVVRALPLLADLRRRRAGDLSGGVAAFGALLVVQGADVHPGCRPSGAGRPGPCSPCRTSGSSRSACSACSGPPS
jgi:ABC-type branched-subunit amino acid transport system ATPase component